MDIKEERANFEAGQEAKEVEEKDEEVNEPAPSLVSYMYTPPPPPYLPFTYTCIQGSRVMVQDRR